MATATAPSDSTPVVADRPRSGVASDLLAVAWAAGAAPPREIRVRPELFGRLVTQVGPALDEHRLLGEPAGVPLVVDPQLPGAPGFEVRRVAPGGPVRPRGPLPGQDS